MRGTKEDEIGVGSSLVHRGFSVNSRLDKHKAIRQFDAFILMPRLEKMRCVDKKSGHV